MSVGSEVRKRRKAQGLTQEQLAEKSGLTFSYLSTVETDKRDPSVSTLIALAHALGARPGDLLEDAPETSPHAKDIASLYEAAPRDVQEGVFLILRAYAPRKG
jgi:transcriptional regulator with XRE-family HTH domain